MQGEFERIVSANWTPEEEATADAIHFTQFELDGLVAARMRIGIARLNAYANTHTS